LKTLPALQNKKGQLEKSFEEILKHFRWVETHFICYSFYQEELRTTTRRVNDRPRPL